MRVPGDKRFLRGFTLIELVVVVVVIGILAAIAIPTYHKTVEKQYGDKAKLILQTIYTAEKMYKMDYNTYGSLKDLINNKYIEDPRITDKKFNYSHPNITGTTFEIRATRNRKYLAITHAGPVTSGHWTWPY